MARDLPIELVTEDNHILELTGKAPPLESAVIPDLGFPQEVEAGALHHLGPTGEAIGPEEDGGSKNPLESTDETLVFLAALPHAECLEHFGAALETNGLAPLLNCERGQVDGYQPVLPEGKAKLWMPGDLEEKASVSALEEQFTSPWSTDWQSAQHERAGAETQSLILLLPLDSNQAAVLGLPQFLLGNNQFRSDLPEYGAGRLKF